MPPTPKLIPTYLLYDVIALFIGRESNCAIGWLKLNPLTYTQEGVCIDMVGSWSIRGSRPPKALRNKESQILYGAIQVRFRAILFK